MQDAAPFLTLLGSLFLVSLLVTPIATRLKVPRVTLLILSGILLGPHISGFISSESRDLFPIIANITLLIVGYLLGARLNREFISRYARGVSMASLTITVLTSLTVALGLQMMGFSIELAWLMGALAAATDPAATLDVLNQNPARNHFGKILEGVVAMDDVLGLLLFTFILGGLQVFNGNGDPGPHLWHVVRDIGGALLIGSVMGALVAWLLEKKPVGKPVIVESLAFIFLCGGLAMLAEVGVLLAAMVMGTVMVNRDGSGADHLHDIENIEEPFLVLFFIMAGSALDLSQLDQIGALGIAYIVLRILGRFLGGLVVPISDFNPTQRRWLGLALLPQAGVAMGMALVASESYPGLADQIIPVAIAATVLFELLGPMATGLAIRRQNRSFVR